MAPSISGKLRAAMPWTRLDVRAAEPGMLCLDAGERREHHPSREGGDVLHRVEHHLVRLAVEAERRAPQIARRRAGYPGSGPSSSARTRR